MMLQKRAPKKSSWLRLCIPQHIVCDNDAKSVSLIQPIIFDMTLRAPFISKWCEFILCRIPIWLWTDHWPCFNELLQINTRMTWNRTRGNIVSNCAALNKHAMLNLHVQKNTHLKVHPVAAQHKTNLHPYDICTGDTLQNHRMWTICIYPQYTPHRCNWGVCLGNCYMLCHR